MTKIAVLVGSLREKSINKYLAHGLEKLLPEGVEFDYIDLASLPLYNQDLEIDFPVAAQGMKNKIEAADGVLFVTPEYNRSIPGVLKNAIDWASRPWGRNSFNQKPTAIIGASSGLVGTAVAQSDLRHIGGYLNVKLMGQPELYFSLAGSKLEENGDIKPEEKEKLQNYIAAFVGWVEKEKAIS